MTIAPAESNNAVMRIFATDSPLSSAGLSPLTTVADIEIRQTGTGMEIRAQIKYFACNNLFKFKITDNAFVIHKNNIDKSMASVAFLLSQAPFIVQETNKVWQRCHTI